VGAAGIEPATARCKTRTPHGTTPQAATRDLRPVHQGAAALTALRDFAPRLTTPHDRPEPIALLRRLRVGRTGGNNPDDSPVRIGAVPDPPRRRHLVLPLVKQTTADLALRQLPPEPVLSSGVLRAQGPVNTIQASHVLARATRHSSSQPFAASDVANRASHPSGRAGGATRSPCLAGKGHAPSGTGTSPRSDSSGRISSSVRAGSE
jgi:hypothetical protein